MNHDLRKTLIFVGAALLMTGAAFVSSRARDARPEAFDDQGTKFFADFDPTTATTLEVIEVDPATLTPLPFKVTFKDGRWVIPSHYDYPADAKKRLVDTATGIVGLVKDSIRSDRADDQEAFGVVDPTDTKTAAIKGFGKRVTLKDASDKVLADFLIGKEVQGHPDQRYVRVPGQKRTYGVNVKVDLSTRFADWIETNLLKLEASHARRIVIDHKSFDLATRQLIPGDVVTLTRPDAAAPWAVEGLPEGKEPNTEALTALTSALADLKIAGIRPKPEGLTADLREATGDLKPKTQQAMLSLVNKGFYPTSRGMLSSKGELTVSTDEGVVYTLRYGEVVVAAGNELSAGTDEQTPEQKAEAKKNPLKAQQETSEGRYLFVTTTFDPGLIPPPKPSSDPDDQFPDDPFAYDADGAEPKLTEPSPRAVERAAKAQAERDKQVADGQKRAKELSDRFAAWYYVTPGESYKNIVADRGTLVRDKGSKPATPPPGGRPQIPGLGNIPGLGQFDPEKMP